MLNTSLLSKIALICGLAILPSAALADTFDVKVKTGKVKFGGTDANVWVTLYSLMPASQTSVDSGAIQLSNHGANAFTAGSTRTCRITTPSNIKLKNLYGMKLEQDNTGAEPDWFVESIEVKNVDDGKTMTFLCDGWLGKGTGNSRYLKPFEHF